MKSNFYSSYESESVLLWQPRASLRLCKSGALLELSRWSCGPVGYANLCLYDGFVHFRLGRFLCWMLLVWVIQIMASLYPGFSWEWCVIFRLLSTM
jgi:hypothetical protein